MGSLDTVPIQIEAQLRFYMEQSVPHLIEAIYRYNGGDREDGRAVFDGFFNKFEIMASC